MSLNVILIIIDISVIKQKMYKGKNSNPMSFAIGPNKGGTTVEPIYALAICMPMIVPEFSAPKLYGVE